MTNTNQQFEDFEREYVNDDDSDVSQEVSMGYYFIEIVNLLPRNIFTDEYIQRNSPLLTSITNEFYLDGSIEPQFAAKQLEVIFTSILVHGLR